MNEHALEVLEYPQIVDLLAGFANVTPPVYPDWIAEHPDIAKRPVWVELSTYVGVIGGSGYDYLAYVTYLRDKQWGLASNGQPSPVPVDVHDEAAPARLGQWCRAPLIDCTLSFAIVLLFSAVFVACGTEILGQAHKVPAGAAFITTPLPAASEAAIDQQPRIRGKL